MKRIFFLPFWFSQHALLVSQTMDFSYIVLTLSPLSNSPLSEKHTFLQTVVAQKMIANE